MTVESSNTKQTINFSRPRPPPLKEAPPQDKKPPERYCGESATKGYNKELPETPPADINEFPLPPTKEKPGLWFPTNSGTKIPGATETFSQIVGKGGTDARQEEENHEKQV